MRSLKALEKDKAIQNLINIEYIDVKKLKYKFINVNVNQLKLLCNRVFVYLRIYLKLICLFSFRWLF